MLRARLFAVVTLGTMFAVGCGRGGLGDFDGTGAPGEETGVDTGVVDTSVDSFEFDSPDYDTGVIDYDTGIIDYDTGVIGYDTGVIDYDTGVITFDTGVIDYDTGLVDTGIPIDTGVPDTGFDAPPEGGILCGGSYCNASTQECCASFTGVSCVSKGSCSGGTTLSCSSSASCSVPGQVCCFSGFLGGGTPSATCQFFCAGFRLCATSAECGPGQTCQAVFGGYRVCR